MLNVRWVCLGGIWTKGVLLSPCFRGGMGRVEYCWDRCSCNFSSPNKFIIVLPCDLLVDNNTYLKMFIFKMSYWLHWWWWLWQPKCICCNNNKNKGNEGPMLVILNCTLQHNENNGWTLLMSITTIRLWWTTALSQHPSLAAVLASHTPQKINELNPLEMKRRLLYLKTQFVPRSKHFSFRL